MPKSANRFSTWLRFAGMAAFVALAQPRARAESDRAGVEFFEKHIRPVLVRECYECHSANSDSVMSGLRLDTADGMLKGGDNGPAVIPGNAKNSLLIQALRQGKFEMPPDGKLPDETIGHFVSWIRLGAPMPKSTRPPANGQRDAEPDRDFWAFQPPKKTVPPDVSDEEWPRGGIDRFVLARLERNGLSPVDDADRVSLIRRAYFDLWGLPPSPQAVRDFVDDRSPRAFEKLVDRLLDSPRFGERWGRHWLDVARYAESTGHERNFLYPHAWRYRDYVIAALNDDKPYDRFLLEQIAGDKLPAESRLQRDQQHTATGFLALGPRNLLGRDDEFQLDNADDQINVTMRAILGLTVSCARCHDHKFDPISTEEYYGLAGIFLSTETLYGTQPGTGGGSNRHPTELVPIGADAQERHDAMLAHGKRVASVTKEFGKAQGRLKKIRSLPEKTLAKRQDELAAAQKKFNQLKKQLDQLKKSGPEPPGYAMGVRDAGKIVDTPVRISGDSRNKGKVALRRVLAACTVGTPPEMPKDASGRLELAQWLVNPQHPLTARVMVNRIWHHLMGRGLVATVDNFGHNGRRPSHPQLLDWLAVDFQQEGWSIKRMIRQIMLSRAYQLSANYDSANYAADPDNLLLWRKSPQRLDAEAIRDAMLAVSGRLEFKPPKNGSLVANLGDGCLVRQINPDGLKVDVNCRSVYLPAARFFEPEMLQVFDGASASLVVGNRAETNVPSQALFLLNNEFVIEQSRHAADRVFAREDLDTCGRIELAFQLSFGRRPDKVELQRALDYVDGGLKLAESNDQKLRRQIWAGLFQALFTSAEFRYVY